MKTMWRENRETKRPKETEKQTKLNEEKLRDERRDQDGQRMWLTWRYKDGSNKER